MTKTKFILKIFLTILGIYILACILIYFNQEKFIFHPSKLSKEAEFSFDNKFTEVNLVTSDSLKINCLYFETENPKGVIYYLHGNSGNLSGWGDIAGLYLNSGYNILIPDFRGFGKSEGEIENEKQFYEDMQLGYNFLKEKFNEDKIVVIGYSIGTGIASHLASVNNPKLLILQAPYYNLTEMTKTRMPFVPTFLLKYKFDNATNISKAKCPVYIFHGNEDGVISYSQSLKLKKHLKENDEFITLNGQKHNGINENFEYIKKLEKILFVTNNDSLKIIENTFKKTFEDFPVSLYKGKLAEPDFSGHPYSADKNFVELIKTECKKIQVNFAGKYTIIQKNCGLHCEHIIAIVDRITGRILENSAITSESCGFKYEASSKLLITNSNVFVDNNMDDFYESWCMPEYYIWENNNLEKIKN